MKTKVISLIILAMFCNVFSFGQYKVLLENGKSIDVSSLHIVNERVALSTGQMIDKSDILCIIPEEGRSYTFLKKNDKKTKIQKRDIKNEYQGTDKAKIFAYKYSGVEQNVGQLYVLNSDNSLTEDEFKLAFTQQQGKITIRKVVLFAIVVPIFLYSLINFTGTLKEVNSI